MDKNKALIEIEKLLLGKGIEKESLFGAVDEKGFFSAKKVLEIMKPALSQMCDEPEEGWLKNTYEYVLGQLFTHKKKDVQESESLQETRLYLLNLLRALYVYEHEVTVFDPTVEMHLMSPEEIIKGNYNKEYLRLLRFIDRNYLYEFMRIGVEVTPYNTLGHISGVHYVAMHVARQLSALKIPVDLGLISGAAAGHDIGKYGCKKSEEKRIPYLHYYYTDLCFNRFDMPMIGYIAANHSTWDLELENLSVESLLLIYADFKVKSSRDATGKEQVHFYSLADSFDVILSKLDNVDAAKKHRYHKVYNKLKDFEDYMISLGVNVELPEIPTRIPMEPVAAGKKDIALLEKDQVVNEFKYLAVEHNIRLMNKLYSEEEFAGFLETVRSESKWKTLRTYISILGNSSIYMTEKQKLMTLRFLNELLLHKESDIRSQAGEIIGQIIARFNEEYKKELPEGVDLPDKEVTNLSLWEELLDVIMTPDYKLTEQHKKWIANSLKSIVRSLLANCHPSRKAAYIDALLACCHKENLGKRNKESLVQAFVNVKPNDCTQWQKEQFLEFASKMMEDSDSGIRIAAISLHCHFNENQPADGYIRSLKAGMGLDPEKPLPREALADMYLDNLKAGTPWTMKLANIKLMLNSLEAETTGSHILHVATHLGNLVKVSETVIVRRSAGEALVSIIDKMPLEQRNEIAVELGKGLEIGDYQFSKYIPDYLGVIMLRLPPRELDELIADLEKLLETTNGQVAAAVLHTFGVVIENYKSYRDYFGSEESAEVTLERKKRMVNLLIRGFANYEDAISQEALWTIGTNFFASQKFSIEEKYDLFCHCGKKILSLYTGRDESELDFYNNTIVLNQIYRFISEYELEVGAFDIPENRKIAFFPGTFDPFSLSHKAIATEIRDLGYDVYLALDEFSWSKKTQPRLQRRRILSMSVADEDNIYIFPDDIPVNIANPRDLKKLKEIFAGKEIFFVAGSDVIENASCYRAAPVEDSIHTFNHIVFKRKSDERRNGPQKNASHPISGDIVNLHLEEHYEDISSTRIRENIDSNRDISNLIDPVAQNYIYDRNLYLREPAYKHVLQARDISLEVLKQGDHRILEDLADELESYGYDVAKVGEYLDRRDVKVVTLRDGLLDDQVVAVAAVSRVDSIDLFNAFHDQEIASYIRNKAAGAIAVIGGIFTSQKSGINNLEQIILVEMLSELLAQDYTYVVYNPCHEAGLSGKGRKAVERQGFVNIAPAGSKPIFAVDMRSPLIIFKNVDTMIKSPLNKNEKVLRAVEVAHKNLLAMLTSMYPGELIISYNSVIMHHKMINLIARINGVSPTPYAEKKYGNYMAVPFGKVLGDVVVPNTVTKALHTEKYFNNDVSGFTIEEKSYYSPLENQVKTIKSFNRPVILVDDLLHKGYRMKAIDPILKDNDVEVADTVVGVQTGRGRDLMTIKERTVDSAYYLPNLKCWIDEGAMYPYIGGDSIKDEGTSVSGHGEIPALNLVLPYATPTFLENVSSRSIYEYSMTCLENARDILKTLEEEYQKEFEQKLTVKRLGEVIGVPKYPDLGNHVSLDENAAPSVYIEKDIEKLIRMRKMFR